MAQAWLLKCARVVCVETTENIEKSEHKDKLLAAIFRERIRSMALSAACVHSTYHTPNKEIVMGRCGIRECMHSKMLHLLMCSWFYVFRSNCLIRGGKRWFLHVQLLLSLLLELLFLFTWAKSTTFFTFHGSLVKCVMIF